MAYMKDEKNFPETLQEAIKYFADPDNALNFMTSLRWPDGIPMCPRCGSNKSIFISTRRLWKCKGCKKQFAIKLGTVMEDSPIGLDKWLCAIWMIANCKNGISSYEIHRALGITQKSAWFLLHRIRLAMKTETFEKLSGPVEVDETYVGGQAINKHKNHKPRGMGRGSSGKTIVMGILDRSGEVRTKVIPDIKKPTIQNIIKAHVKPGAEVYTDDFTPYRGLSSTYTHEVINHMAGYVRGHVHTNSIENFWSLLKRSINGTYVSVMPFHLFRYVDEQAFRFNNRKFKDVDRFIMACSQMSERRLTYNNLINNRPI